MSDHPPSRFQVDRLGPAHRPSPLAMPSPGSFVSDDVRIFVDPHLEPVRDHWRRGVEPPTFEVAGPRERLFFDPEASRAAITTCGGLSPGINDVVRALVIQLEERYGLRRILGVRNGYQGLAGGVGAQLVPLDVETVGPLREQGGTVLGTSRGHPPVPEMVDSLVAHDIDVLFTIGGDGTMRGALEISREIRRRGLRVAVVGIPKTIDNDIPWVRRSFGFETAVVHASRAVRSAGTEARSVENGIGLVKLMGRHSGYIAANATLAASDVDCCLVPEVPFGLDGELGLLAFLERRLALRSHAVIVVAEGAGQRFFQDDPGTDASGNRRLADIGPLLRRRIEEHFAGRGRPAHLKYIDPSYLIRSAPANPSDSLFCARLAQNAAHAALAGRTAMLVGYWHGRMTHVPLSALGGERKSIDPHGELWRNVLESTGQPLAMG